MPFAGIYRLGWSAAAGGEFRWILPPSRASPSTTESRVRPLVLRGVCGVENRFWHDADIRLPYALITKTPNSTLQTRAQEPSLRWTIQRRAQPENGPARSHRAGRRSRGRHTKCSRVLIPPPAAPFWVAS